MGGSKRRLAVVSGLVAVILIAGILGLTLFQSKSNNELPVASFTYTNDDSSLNVAFNASTSYDPNGSIASCAWTFGDGTTGEGVVVMHGYLKAGTYEAVLTVKDNEGGKSHASKTFLVDIRPVVVLDVVSASGFTVVLSGANSHDPDGGSLEYEWIFYRHGADVSDTVQIRTAYEVEVTHIFDAPGDYAVYLAVTDEQGLTMSTSHGFQIPIGD